MMTLVEQCFTHVSKRNKVQNLSVENNYQIQSSNTQPEINKVKNQQTYSILLVSRGIIKIGFVRVTSNRIAGDPSTSDCVKSFSTSVTLLLILTMFPGLCGAIPIK